MREVKSSEREKLFERLRYYALAAFEVDANARNIKLTFVSTVDGEEDVIINLFELLLIRVSRTSDDEGPYLIGDIRLAALSGAEDKNLMERLGYSFREGDTDDLPAFTRQLFHFFLEGSICVDIVCEGYSMWAGRKPLDADEVLNDSG